MSFPLPPSDNIYKFLAISGILVLLSTQTLYWSSTREYLEKVIEIEPAVKALEVESRQLRDDSYEVESELQRTKEGARLRQLRELDKQNRSRNDAIGVKLAEMKGKAELLRRLEGRLKLVTMLAVGGGVLGLVLTIGGFALWWKRVQVYQDRALKRPR